MHIKLSVLLLFCLSIGCNSPKTTENSQNVPATENYESESLQIKKISEHVYEHVSFLETESFGKVACNGMIVVNQNEAVVFDTPADNATSEELIDWVEKNLDCKIKAVVPTHFHADCLGGLEAFHGHGIASYANNLTLQFADSNQTVVPQHGFDNRQEFQVGNEKVEVGFYGAGHTRDNVIGYFPKDQVIFGGCLIKEIGAGKGNLEDADTTTWSATVTKLKADFPEAQTVIPGHGKYGGTELLDYTIKLFQPAQ